MATVVKYLSNIDSESASDKILTLKLTMLLALTSAGRAHEITFLDKNFLVKHHTKYVFFFNKPTKVSKPGKPRPPLKFPHFTEDLNMCVCHHIDLYLTRSAPWRKGQGQLLLSHINPHNAVTTSTVSRWVVEVLKLSGVDTETFKGHSTRSASSSKASIQGVPLKEILKRAYWSSSTIFENRYKKDIECNSDSETNLFDFAILKK